MTRDASQPEDPRRKRLRFQCWHRGTREMDLILGPFADRHMNGLTEKELDELERLIELPDTTVYHWIAGRDLVPPEHRSAVLARIKAFIVASHG